MQVVTADGVTSAVAEEPPTTKNVRVARRGVAGGLSALVIYMLLTVYAWTTGWQHEQEPVAFARGILILSMVAGLGVALFGYGLDRSDRKVAAAAAVAEKATFDREAWELKQFDELHDADTMLAEGLRSVAAAQKDLAGAQRDLAAQMRELRTLVAEHDLRAAPRRRAERQQSRRHSRRRHSRPRRAEQREARQGDNVTQLPDDPEVLRAARGLASRVIDAEKRRAEDNSEDRKRM